MFMKKTVIFAFLFLASLFSACNEVNDLFPGKGKGSENRLKKYSNKVVLDWNTAALEAMGGTTYQHSLLAAHINAMTHLAIHDALNAVAPAYETYAYQGKDAGADPIAAAASAGYEVLLGLLPEQKELLDDYLARSLEEVKEGPGKQKGLAVGKAAAKAILDLRQNDGAFQDPIGAIAPSTVPGVYQAVPPFAFVFAPHWRTMQPFSLMQPDQFRSAPHPVIGSQAYADAYDEVKAVGILNSTTRTADQTAYAKYWYEFSEMGWNHVTRIVAANKKLGLLETARLFALVDMAMADSYTAGWDSKFHYDFWRPYTAIRAAATDGNSYTAPDPAWEPLMPTPPVQDYPSTHSALGNAAATVLAHVVGNNTPFTLVSSTADPAGSSRSFTSFSQAADENADSRVMAGIHFRFACQAGQELGNKVGTWVTQTNLRPLE
jgi:hypothetical protein